jgi:hypothetical protein
VVWSLRGVGWGKIAVFRPRLIPRWGSETASNLYFFFIMFIKIFLGIILN